MSPAPADPPRDHAIPTATPLPRDHADFAPGAPRRLSSDGPWEDVVGYSRAVVVPAGAARVLVAGCTAVVDGAPVHPGDAHAQALTALDAALTALARAGARPADVVRSRMYVVGPEHCAAVGRAHAELLGAVRPAATMVCVAALVDPALLVEVELEAALAGGAA